ncbi:hypothetical protein BGZ99_002345, partial [Dissophora globulifera]
LKMNIRKLALLLAMMTAVLAVPGVVGIEKRCKDRCGDHVMNGCGCDDTIMKREI